VAADEDEPLFMSLVSDLFPNVVFEKTSYGKLEEAIKSQTEEQGLIYHEPWVLKLIQVIECFAYNFKCIDDLIYAKCVVVVNVYSFDIIQFS